MAMKLENTFARVKFIILMTNRNPTTKIFFNDCDMTYFNDGKMWVATATRSK